MVSIFVHPNFLRPRSLRWSLPRNRLPGVSVLNQWESQPNLELLSWNISISAPFHLRIRIPQGKKRKVLDLDECFVNLGPSHALRNAPKVRTEPALSFSKILPRLCCRCSQALRWNMPSIPNSFTVVGVNQRFLSLSNMFGLSSFLTFPNYILAL